MGCRGGSLFGAVVVSTGRKYAGFRAVFRCVSVPLSLCCFCFPAIPAKYALFRILRGFWRGFSCYVWVCLAWVLCVACGAFYVRVRLGGFGACGVFRLSFSSFLLFSSLVLLSSCSPAWLPALPAFLLFVLFSWLCGLAFGVGWVVGFLSLSDGFRHKKKGRVLRPFLRCVVSWLLESVTGGQLI